MTCPLFSTTCSTLDALLVFVPSMTFKACLRPTQHSTCFFFVFKNQQSSSTSKTSGVTESEREWEYREEKRLWKNSFHKARRLRLTLHLNFWSLIVGREARNQERIPQMNIAKAAEKTVMFTLLFGHTEKVQWNTKVVMPFIDTLRSHFFDV